MKYVYGDPNMMSISGGIGYGGVQKSHTPAQSPVQQAIQPIEVPVIPLEELRGATENFGSSTFVGEGSYGRVYRGKLKNGRDAAIKKFDFSNQQDSDNEFLAQVLFCSIHLNGFYYIF
jgi:pto-interacting protein 1